MKRIYLAGPEVFHPNAVQLGVQKKAICTQHGFIGVYPIDAELELPGRSKREAGLRIGKANQDLIRSCDIVVANITPFRGPSADVGTVWEMGFAAGLGRRVFAYSNDPRQFTERSRQLFPLDQQTEELRDADGMLVEDFDLADNLMIESSLAETGGFLEIANARSNDPFADLATFERCIQRIPTARTD